MNKKSELIGSIILIVSIVFILAIFSMLFKDVQITGMATKSINNDIIVTQETPLTKIPKTEEPKIITQDDNGTLNMCNNHILSTDNAVYTFNCSTGIITSVYDKITSREILDITTSKGCGWTLWNGTNWMGGSAEDPYDSNITVILNNSNTFTFQKQYSQINTTMSYYIANEVLFIDTNFSSANLLYYDNITVRYICDIDESYLNNKRVFPWDTINTANPASQGSISSFISKTFYIDARETGNIDYIFVNNDSSGFIFAVVMPTGNGGNAGSIFEQSIKIDKSALDMPLQYRQAPIALNNSDIPINLAFTITNNLQALNNIYYNNRDNAQINGAWLNTCYETSILNYSSFVAAYDKGVRLWNMNCWLPDNQVLPHDGSSWYPTFFYGNAANVSYLNDIAGLAKSAGIEPFLYYVAAEVNQTTADAHYSNDIGINSSGEKMISTYTDMPRYYMTFDNKSGWFKNASNDIYYLVNNIPNIEGIYLDINSIRQKEYNSSDYNYFWDVDKQKKFTFVQYGYNDFLENISNLLDSHNKNLIINGAHQALLVQYSAGITEDTDNLNSIPGNKLISLGKPVYMVSLTKNQTYLMNDSILWGVRPAMSFYYLNISSKYNYTPYEFMLSDYVASDSLLNFHANETAYVYYVEYNHTLTFNNPELNYSRPTARDFIRLNDGKYIATNTTTLNINNFADGYTDVIIMNSPSGCSIFSNMSILNHNYIGYYCNNTVINYSVYDNILNITALEYVIIDLSYLSLFEPFNDIKNLSNGVILASNVDNYSITLTPNQQIEVGDFVEDNVTINESNESINTPPNITISLTQGLNCSTNATDIDNDTLNVTIEWYYNSTLNRTVNASSNIQTNYTGEHYCKARAYDGMNYSLWATSNTITINATINETINETVNETIVEEEESSGGGGGGSSYTPPVVVEDTSEDVNNNVSTENTTTINTSQNTIDVPIEETIITEEVPTQPIIERPTTIVNKYWIYFAVFLAFFLIAIIFFIKKGVPIKQDLAAYIKKSLDQGYEYKSIRRVLSKHYKQTEIDNHFHVLRRNNISPSKIQKESKPFTNEVNTYIEKQKQIGYTEKEILKVLEKQGFRK